MRHCIYLHGEEAFGKLRALATAEDRTLGEMVAVCIKGYVSSRTAKASVVKSEATGSTDHAAAVSSVHRRIQDHLETLHGIPAIPVVEEHAPRTPKVGRHEPQPAVNPGFSEPDPELGF